VPKEFVESMPEFFRYFLGSSIAFGAVAAILLNLVLPEREEPAAA
jgi:NCS2 family nucleobase:cation symporter-2